MKTILKTIIALILLILFSSCGTDLVDPQSGDTGVRSAVKSSLPTIKSVIIDTEGDSSLYINTGSQSGLKRWLTGVVYAKDNTTVICRFVLVEVYSKVSKCRILSLTDNVQAGCRVEIVRDAK